MCYCFQFMTFFSIIFLLDGSTVEKIDVKYLISLMNREATFPGGKDKKALGCFESCYLAPKRDDKSYRWCQNRFPCSSETTSHISLSLGETFPDP